MVTSRETRLARVMRAFSACREGMLNVGAQFESGLCFCCFFTSRIVDNGIRITVTVPEDSRQLFKEKSEHI